MNIRKVLNDIGEVERLIYILRIREEFEEFSDLMRGNGENIIKQKEGDFM